MNQRYPKIPFLTIEQRLLYGAEIKMPSLIKHHAHDSSGSDVLDRKMSFNWSRNAPHIRSLYRPWREGDGYPEADLVLAEASLGIRLPALLREFYLYWGTRDDLCRSRERVLRPQELFVRSGSLVFCIENQGVLYWGIRPEFACEHDPPVHFLYDPDVEEDLTRLSHVRLSAFLDALAYAHAFAGGAAHGGVSRGGADRPDALTGSPELGGVGPGVAHLGPHPRPRYATLDTPRERGTGSRLLVHRSLGCGEDLCGY